MGLLNHPVFTSFTKPNLAWFILTGDVTTYIPSIILQIYQIFVFYDICENDSSLQQIESITNNSDGMETTCRSCFYCLFNSSMFTSYFTQNNLFCKIFLQSELIIFVQHLISNFSVFFYIIFFVFCFLIFIFKLKD